MSKKLQIQVSSLHFHGTSTRSLRNMSCTYFFILATTSICQNFQGNSKQTSVSCTYRIDLLTDLKRNPNKWCWLQKLSTQYPLLQWDEYDLAGNYTVSSRSSKFNCTWLKALWQPITNSLTFNWTKNIICTAHYCTSRWKNEVEAHNYITSRLIFSLKTTLNSMLVLLYYAEYKILRAPQQPQAASDSWWIVISLIVVVKFCDRSADLASWVLK